jgi:hypothetical protein
MPLIRAHKSKKKGTSQRKIESNRRNSLHSTGPENTQRMRYNALRHGLLAEGLTQWDDAEKYEENIHALTAIYPSSDPVDTFLIEQMALEMVRSRRTVRLEAETITLLSCRPDPSSDPTSDRCTLLIDPGTMKEYAGPVLDRLQRYTSANLNRTLRCRRELERIRRDEPGPEHRHRHRERRYSHHLVVLFNLVRARLEPLTTPASRRCCAASSKSHNVALASVQKSGFAIRWLANTPSCGPRFAEDGSAAT